MATLYQYRSISSEERVKYLLSLLREGAVRFSPPNEFNDPFDFCPTCLHELPDDAFPHAVGNQINFGIQAAHSKLFGVWCLTPYPDRMLMWSHYADQHRGVCVGFDPEILIGKMPVNDLGHPAFSPARKVEYRADRPTDEWPDAFFVKSLEWQHENEYRVVSHRVEGMPAWGPGVWNIPPEAVVELIFGARTPPEKIHEISSMLAESRPNVSLRVVVPDMKRFGLRVENLTEQPIVGKMQGSVADPSGGWLSF